MPCLRADFAFFHSSRNRGSPFERVNLHRAVRHFRRRTHNWSFHQYIESPVRPCPRRGMEWSHAATTCRLAARTVSSNDSVDLAQPSSSISLVSSKCSRSLSLLSRFFTGGAPYLSAPSCIHWVIPFQNAKLNALVVTQGYYLEDGARQS